MTEFEVDTATVPARERVDLWHQSLLKTFGPVHVEPLPGELPSAAMRLTRRGDFAIHSMRYSGLRLSRRPADLARVQDEYFTLTLPTASMPVVQADQPKILEAGHIYLFNHAVTYRTRAHGEYRTNSIGFPARVLRERIGNLLPFYDLSASTSSREGAELVRAFAAHLSQGAARWSEQEFQLLISQLLDLLGMFLQGPASAWMSGESSTRAGHMQRAMQHIRKSAADHGLSPAQVAGACGISLSYLHDVFRQAGLGVEATIFEERLQLARRLLADPYRSGTPIQTLCYEAGFNDPAHFSRKFRARFNQTPGDLRRGARFPHE